jgi:oligoendopeptidase F
MPSQLTRAQVPVEQTWDLAHICPSPAEWEADLRRVEAALPGLAAYRGRLGEGAATLLAFLRARDEAAERFEKVGSYASLASSVDGLAVENQARQGRATALRARVAETVSFVRDELLALPAGTLERYLTTEPGLAPYRPQLEQALLWRGHLLAPGAEQALAALDGTLALPGSIWRRVNAADLACAPVDDGRGGQTAVSVSRWQFGFVAAPDRGLRRRAYESLNAGLGRHKHTLAATLASNIQRNVVMARLRGYRSAVEMFLAHQQVPEPVYRTLLQVVFDGMQPHMQRLARLRRRVLGIERMHHYDLQAPLDPAFEATLDYGEAERLILAGLQALGDEYCAIMKTALRERWVDRADNAGKASGAFCATVFGVHPYVFTTWQGSLRSALTLAHELGHAGAVTLAAQNQVVSNLPGPGSEALCGLQESLFAIEAPSTANELLVGQHVLAATRDARLRRSVIQQFLGTFTHNMVTHLLEAHFEQRLYDLAEAGQPITTDTVLDVQGEVFQRFYGDTVALDDEDRLYWAQQWHFYVGLYPYSYSAGLAWGFAAADAIRREGRPAVERWLAMLRLGATRPPLELARVAGVDMASPEPLRHTIAYLGTLLDELEASFT